MCRPCSAAYHREHYLANKQRYVDQAAVRRKALVWERMRFLVDFFASHPCVDCGEEDPLVLEFDHLRDKEFTISQALYDRGWGSIYEEIAKCDVVCANCHRRRTAHRRRSIKVQLLEDSRRRG